MMQPSALPTTFRALEGKVSHVRRVSDTEYCSTCPKCGDAGHDTRSGPPDRFRMFDDGHPTGWCRRCSYLWYPDMAADAKPPTPQEFEHWRQERIAREEARKRSAERALAQLRSAEVWTRYHEALGKYGREYWRWRGIPDAWQNFWELGWCPEQHVMLHDGRGLITPSATIPLFNNDREVLNVKHRLVDVHDSGMKYRYEITGQGQPLFLCMPGDSLEGHVIVIEGEIKAAVTFVTLDDGKVVMAGLPGATPSNEVLTQLEKAERLTLVLDPGAEQQARKLAERLGAERCRILVTCAKIDDAILAHGADKYDVRRWLMQARKVA